MSDDYLKKQLDEIKHQLTQLRIDIVEAKTETAKGRIDGLKEGISERNRTIFDWEYSRLLQTRSEFSIYFSIFLSAIIGVLGNWYVNLLFQPPSETVNFGLVLASILILGVLFYLSIRMFLINREFKKQLKEVKEAFNQWKKNTTKEINEFLEQQEKNIEKDKIEADTV